MAYSSRFETGNYDRLVIDEDGTVWIEYRGLGSPEHAPVLTSALKYLKVSEFTEICDRRKKPDTKRYKLKHK